MMCSTIGTHVDLQRGTTYKSKLLDQPGPLLLGLGSIERNGGFRSDKLRTYGGPSPEKLLVYSGDLYVSLKDVTQSGDLLGSIARVPTNISVGRMTQDTVKLCFKTDISKKYFYWLLRTPQYRQYCRSHATGTTNLGLSREDFFNFKIPEFSAIREKIVNILELVESKIEFNRQANQTLEAIAQAIFKSWFVDFEPTQAKIAAREKGQDPEQAALCAISGKSSDELEQLTSDQLSQLKTTAALFPDALVESELGEIPQGWEVFPLGEMIEFNPKRTLKKGTLAPYLDMKNVPTQGHLADDVYLREMASGTKFINGDTLLARITPCLENGKTAFVDFLEQDQVGWGSTEYIIMMPKDARPVSLGYFIARLDSFRSKAIQTMTGTSGRQRANAKALSEQLWINYPVTLLNQFDLIAGGYLAKAKENGQESKSLAAILDTLLPKLLSGELPPNSQQPAHTEKSDMLNTAQSRHRGAS